MNSTVLMLLMSLLGIMLAFTQVLLKRFLKLYTMLQGGFLDKVFLLLRSYLVWVIILGAIISIGLWIWILPRTKLSTVYPMISLSYVAMLFFAYFLEHESIHWTNIAGVVLIMGGVVLLAFGR